MTTEPKGETSFINTAMTSEGGTTSNTNLFDPTI